MSCIFSEKLALLPPPLEILDPHLKAVLICFAQNLSRQAFVPVRCYGLNGSGNGNIVLLYTMLNIHTQLMWEVKRDQDLTKPFCTLPGGLGGGGGRPYSNNDEWFPVLFKLQCEVFDIILFPVPFKLCLNKRLESIHIKRRRLTM